MKKRSVTREMWEEKEKMLTGTTAGSLEIAAQQAAHVGAVGAR